MKDVFDMSYAPGTGSSEPTGLQTGRLVRRVALEIMTGVAMSATDMDPEHVNPHHTGELNE